jgi:peptide/nickel transport system permease protein
VFGLVVSLLVVAAAVGAPWLAPHDPLAQDILHRLDGPTWAHPLGTDSLGRDLLSRIIFGARIALEVGGPAIAIAVVAGGAIGVLAGYKAGAVDHALIVVMDTIQSFPAVVLALGLLALVGASTRNLVFVIAVGFVPNYARVTRALTLVANAAPYMEVERALGSRNGRLLFVHLLPNIVAPVLVLVAMDLPSAITIEAGLSLLGLGVQAPTPSWGNVLSDGFQYVQDSPWAVLDASAALMLVTLGCTLLGETARDLLDPRLAGFTRRRRLGSRRASREASQ